MLSLLHVKWKRLPVRVFLYPSYRRLHYKIQLIHPNGFQVGYGASACVDPANFDKELGEEYSKINAIDDASNKLWELEGYLLMVTGKTSDML